MRSGPKIVALGAPDYQSIKDVEMFSKILSQHLLDIPEWQLKGFRSPLEQLAYEAWGEEPPRPARTILPAAQALIDIHAYTFTIQSDDAFFIHEATEREDLQTHQALLGQLDPHPREDGQEPRAATPSEDSPSGIY